MNVSSYTVIISDFYHLHVGVLFLFPCNGSVYKEGEYDIVLINFTINAYTHDKEYDPIVLYLSKFCNGNAPPGDHLYYT